jgi:starvation-inducible DNA-binding protein
MTTQLIKSHDLQPDRQAELLQPCVFAAINLALALKQVHWNLRGSKFQTVHEFLDVVIAHARKTSDELAERMVTLGVPARGQAQAAAQSADKAGQSKVPDAFITDVQAVQISTELIAAAVGALRDAQESLAEIDAVTEDLVIGAIQTFEKQLWMLRSHLM